MIGGNVTNDFLDNLAANQYQKMFPVKNPRRPEDLEAKERRAKLIKELRRAKLIKELLKDD